MLIEPLTIDGAFVVTPRQFADPRGLFLESFRADRLAAEIGHAMPVAQVNTSVSAAGVVRGIHFAQVPPGQAKYVTCVRGAVVDVVVDLRWGSATFGRWQAVRLDDGQRRALYLSVGLGHGFCAVTDQATVTYLCSTPYCPRREHAVHALDAQLAIRWPVDDPILSRKDAQAPSLAEARAAGLLPEFDQCQDYLRSLRVGSVA